MCAPAQISLLTIFFLPVKPFNAGLIRQKGKKPGAHTMAQRAETLNIERNRRLAPVVSMRIERKQHILANVTQAAAATYRNAKARAARSYLLVVQKSNVLGTSIMRRVASTKDEKPLQIVALAAGTAFILGVGLRVWRSKRNE